MVWDMFDFNLLCRVSIEEILRFLDWVLTVIMNDDVYLGLLRQHWGLVLPKKEVYFSAI